MSHPNNDYVNQIAALSLKSSDRSSFMAVLEADSSELEMGTEQK